MRAYGLSPRGNRARGPRQVLGGLQLLRCWKWPASGRPPPAAVWLHRPHPHPHLHPQDQGCSPAVEGGIRRRGGGTSRPKDRPCHTPSGHPPPRPALTPAQSLCTGCSPARSSLPQTPRTLPWPSSGSALASCEHHNKTPQTKWLKATEIDSLPAVDIRSLKPGPAGPRPLRRLQGGSSLPLPAFGGSAQPPVFPGL